MDVKQGRSTCPPLGTFVSHERAIRSPPLSRISCRRHAGEDHVELQGRERGSLLAAGGNPRALDLVGVPFDRNVCVLKPLEVMQPSPKGDREREPVPFT